MRKYNRHPLCRGVVPIGRTAVSKTDGHERRCPDRDTDESIGDGRGVRDIQELLDEDESDEMSSDDMLSDISSDEVDDPSGKHSAGEGSDDDEDDDNDFAFRPRGLGFGVLS